MGAFMALSIRLTIRIDAQQLIRVTLSCAIQKPCWGKCWGTEPCYDNNSNDYNAMRRGTGGEGGIRTPGTLARTPHFECGAIDHSATSPGPAATLERSPRGRRAA